MKLFDGGALFLFLWVVLFGYVHSNIHPSVPGDTECVGVACDADHDNAPAAAPVVDDPVDEDEDEDEDEDDGNNGHGNDDDHDDDSNPGKGKGK